MRYAKFYKYKPCEIFERRVLLTLKSDAAVRPNNVYLAALFRNHLGNITHAWTGFDLEGNPLCVEAKATLLVLLVPFPSPLILPFFYRWRR